MHSPDLISFGTPSYILMMVVHVIGCCLSDFEYLHYTCYEKH